MKRTSTTGEPLICSGEGCSHNVFARGMCKKHYNRARQAGLVRRCSIDACEAGVVARGLCNRHYLRLVKHGDPLVTVFAPPGSGTVSGSGYRLLRGGEHPNAKSGVIPEHRLIMSRHLGRPLHPHENVHHRNGDRLDNRLSNLELWTTSQPSGQRICDKLRWAREFLAEYRGEYEEDSHDW